MAGSLLKTIATEYTPLRFGVQALAKCRECSPGHDG